MGNLTVRNLDDRVIEGLKAEAKANERSLEGEVRHVLDLPPVGGPLIMREFSVLGPLNQSVFPAVSLKTTSASDLPPVVGPLIMREFSVLGPLNQSVFPAVSLKTTSARA